MAFQKAVREKLWAKVLLAGPSGSGKTYSALRLAKGLSQKTGGAGVAYIDTEAGRANYYADQFDFDTMILQEPYTPEKYIDAIDEAVAAGYKVVCIDSLTHEWLFLNETHSKMPGNSFQTWGPLKARHKLLMEKILQAPIHIIATARGKDAYVLETNEKGKQTPKKVGEGIDGDKQLEYNYTCTFQLSQDTHVASVTKDNTHIFEGRFDKLTENDGVLLYNWCNSGATPKPRMTTVDENKASTSNLTPEAPIELSYPSELPDAIANIGRLAKQLAANGVTRNEISSAISKFNIVDGKPSANYNAITEIDVARNVLDALSSISK